MKHRYVFSSVTRISDLQDTAFSAQHLGKDEWQNGDYVIGEVQDTSGCSTSIELPTGRIVETYQGDHVIGAIGQRAATLEVVGDWRAISDDMRFDALTPAGLFGKTVSRSVFLNPQLPLVYKGHVTRSGKKLNMRDFVPNHPKDKFNVPMILIVGTSMSAGKTTSGKIIVRQLKEAGFRIAGAKFTGAARYRDVLSFGDAGADYIVDFVDAGLPSTVCDEQEFNRAMDLLLGKLSTYDVDVIVAEAGASPLEPYNGAAAIERLSRYVCYTVLCASDPYAVTGVASAFNLNPDLITGGAANTSAGIELVKKLTGLTALNLLDEESKDILKDKLIAALA